MAKDSADGHSSIETSICLSINVAPGLRADLRVLSSGLLVYFVCVTAVTGQIRGADMFAMYQSIFGVHKSVYLPCYH